MRTFRPLTIAFLLSSLSRSTPTSTLRGNEMPGDDVESTALVDASSNYMCEEAIDVTASGSNKFTHQGSTYRVEPEGFDSDAIGYCSFITRDSKLVWYKFTGNDTCVYTAAKGTDFAPYIAVYRGPTCGDWSCAAQTSYWRTSPAAPGLFNTSLSWVADMDTTYYVALSGEDGQGGEYSIEFKSQKCPKNVGCDSSRAVSNFPFRQSSSFTFGEIPEANCSLAYGTGLWYDFQSDGSCYAVELESEENGYVAFFEGESCEMDNLCVDRIQTGQSWGWHPEIGDIQRLLVGGEGSGQFDLTIQKFDCPNHDLCPQAQLLDDSQLPYSFSGYTSLSEPLGNWSQAVKTCDTVPTGSRGLWFEMIGSGLCYKASLDDGSNTSALAVLEGKYCWEAACVTGGSQRQQLVVTDSSSEISWTTKKGATYRVFAGLVDEFSKFSGVIEQVECSFSQTGDDTSTPSGNCELCPSGSTLKGDLSLPDLLIEDMTCSAVDELMRLETADCDAPARELGFDLSAYCCEGVKLASTCNLCTEGSEVNDKALEGSTGTCKELAKSMRFFYANQSQCQGLQEGARDLCCSPIPSGTSKPDTTVVPDTSEPETTVVPDTTQPDTTVVPDTIKPDTTEPQSCTICSDGSDFDPELTVPSFDDATCGSIATQSLDKLKMTCSEFQERFGSACGCANSKPVCNLCGDSSAVLGAPSKSIPGMDKETCQSMNDALAEIPVDRCQSVREESSKTFRMNGFCECSNVEELESTCTLCGDSNLIDGDYFVPEAGLTCSELADFAQYVTSDELCSSVVSGAGPLCCESIVGIGMGVIQIQTPEPATASCSICPEGSSMKAPEKLLFGSDNVTCEILDDMLSQSQPDECSTLLAAYGSFELTSYCRCDGATAPETCDLCEGGTVLDGETMVFSGEAAYSCEGTADMARHIRDDTLCSIIKRSAPHCCEAP